MMSTIGDTPSDNKKPVMPTPPNLIRSDSDSKPNIKVIFTILLCIIAGGVGFSMLWRFDGTTPFDQVQAAAVIEPTREQAPTREDIIVVVTATPEPTPFVPPAPIIINKPYTVTEYVYITNDIPVERVVTQTQLIEVHPTATPPVPVGFLRLCIFLEGASGLYIDGVGVAGNTCYEYGKFNVVTDISIRVTK